MTVPPNAVSPTPRANDTLYISAVSMPISRAAAGFCAVARIARPNQLARMNHHSAMPHNSDIANAIR